MNRTEHSKKFLERKRYQSYGHSEMPNIIFGPSFPQNEWALHKVPSKHLFTELRSPEFLPMQRPMLLYAPSSTSVGK